jgi:plasmid stabilization system protein ParE
MVKAGTAKIVWDTNALGQLKEILEYLKKQSDQAPKIVKRAIIQRIEQIGRNPLIFELDKLKDEPNEEFRAFVTFSYRITYQAKSDPKEIRILSVRQTSKVPLGY